MKFITSKSALLSALSLASKVVTTNTTLPILENFLFVVESNMLTIVGSDLMTTVKTELTVEGKLDGKVAVPSKLLLDILKALAEQPISITVNGATFAIELTAGDGTYKLAGIDYVQFPKTPEVTEPSIINLPANVLSVAIGKTLFAVSSDELRPAMTGVLCSIASDNITFVATDTRKLVKYRRNDVTGESASSFIMLKKPLGILKDALPDSASPVEIHYNKTNAFFKYGSFEVFCRLIDEKYPDYEAILPKDNTNILTIGRQELVGALKRVGLFANQSTHQIKFTITSGRLELAAEDVDYESEAKELLAVDYRGQDLVIGFNAALLIELLKNLDNDEVQLQMDGPNRQALLVPTDPSEEEDITMLIMPMMLNN